MSVCLISLDQITMYQIKYYSIKLYQIEWHRFEGIRSADPWSNVIRLEVLVRLMLDQMSFDQSFGVFEVAALINFDDAGIFINCCVSLTIHKKAYELLKNFLEVSYKLLMQMYYKLFINFLRASYKLLGSFLPTSYANVS